MLTRHDLAKQIQSLNPTRLTRSELIAPDGSIATINLPKPMWGISRRAMDETLLKSAREAGVTVVQPARCESIENQTIKFRDLTTNQLQTIESQFIVIADGKSACGLAHPKPTKDLGIKAHFKNIDSPQDTISLFGLNGHYIGVAPIEHGNWNLAMSVPAARVRAFNGDLDKLFEQLLTENEELNRRSRRREQASPWIAAPLPRFPVTKTWPINIIPIGNAAAALEPIGGEGMGLALRSAELAAEAINEALNANRPIDTTQLRHNYNKLWQSRRFAARATALMISAPRRAEFLIHAINSISSIKTPALAPLGK